VDGGTGHASTHILTLQPATSDNAWFDHKLTALGERTSNPQILQYDDMTSFARCFTAPPLSSMFTMPSPWHGEPRQATLHAFALVIGQQKASLALVTGRVAP